MFDGKKLHEVFNKPNFFVGFNTSMKGFTQHIDSREVLNQNKSLYTKLNVPDTTFLVVDSKGEEVWFDSDDMKNKVKNIKDKKGNEIHIYKGKAFDKVMTYYYDEYKVDQYSWTGKEMKFLKTVYKRKNFFADKEPHADRAFVFQN